MTIQKQLSEIKELLIRHISESTKRFDNLEAKVDNLEDKVEANAAAIKKYHG